MSVTDLVRRYGGPVSGVLFDDATEVFRAPSVDGVVAYRRGLGCAVAIGDPVCARADTPRLARAFREECRRHRWHTVFTVASERFATWATHEGYAAVEFARELVVDPRRDPLDGPSARHLRGKVHRATREGVSIAEYGGGARDEGVEHAMEHAVSAWLGARRGPQIYLTQVSLFAGRESKRWVYARRDRDVVGVMQLVRLDAYDGYVISQLVATPDAPPGTTELLAVTALRALGAEGCAAVTWGPAPLADLGTVTGLGPLSEKVARVVFRTAARVFHLGARNDYRHKFAFARSMPSYLLFDPPRIGARDAIEVMRAFHAST